MLKNEFVFFKNTPLTDVSKFMHFESDDKRDDFFLNHLFYDKLSVIKEGYNFVKDSLSLTIDCNFDNFLGVNYCSFKNTNGKRYYAFVVQSNYVDYSRTKIVLYIDVLTTFCQGNNLFLYINNPYIIRQHLTQEEYNMLLPQLQNNNDVLPVFTSKYVYQSQFVFNDYYMLFLSNANLESDFGNETNPNFECSSGGVFDGVASSINIYLCEYKEYSSFLDVIKSYPLISNSILSNLMIPSDFIDKDMIVKTGDVNGFNMPFLYKFKDGFESKTITSDKINDKLDLSIKEILNKVSLVSKEKHGHIFRNEYITLNLFGYGQNISINPSFLDDETGVKFIVESIFGHHNEMRIFLKNYMTSKKEKDISVKNGSGEEKITSYKGVGMNNCIVVNDFTELPVPNDNAKLSLIYDAPNRENQNYNSLKNRFNRSASIIKDNGLSFEEKLFNTGLELSRGDLSLSSITSLINNDYERIRNYETQVESAGLHGLSYSNFSKGNIFGISNKSDGVTLKITGLESNEISKIMKYHNRFGYQIESNENTISDINSMEIMNYLKCSCNIMIPNTMNELSTQLKNLLENGIEIYHNDGTKKNPFNQDLIYNNRRF